MQKEHAACCLVLQKRKNKEIMVLMVLLLLARLQSLNAFVDLKIWNNSRRITGLWMVAYHDKMIPKEMRTIH